MRRAVDAGLVNRVGSRRGSAQAWRLRQVHDADVRSDLADHEVLVDALADSDERSLSAVAIRPVAYPALTYGEPGRRGWMLLVADAVGLEPRTAWGWPDAAVRNARAGLRGAELDGAVDGPELMVRLDRAAVRSIGPDRWTTRATLAAHAERDRAAAAADRKAAVLKLRAARDAERAAARRKPVRAVRKARDSGRTEQGGDNAPAARRTIRLPGDWAERGDEAQLRAALAARGMLVVAVSDTDRTVTVEMASAAS